MFDFSCEGLVENKTRLELAHYLTLCWYSIQVRSDKSGGERSSQFSRGVRKILICPFHTEDTVIKAPLSTNETGPVAFPKFAFAVYNSQVQNWYGLICFHFHGELDFWMYHIDFRQNILYLCPNYCRV